MPHTQAGTHRSITFTAIVALIAALIFVQLPPALAATPEYCGKTVLVLDESLSIQNHEDTVRASVTNFLAPLVDSGVETSIVEFAQSSKRVFDYIPVDTTSFDAIFSPYVNATSAGDVYDVPSQLGNATNWDDALDDVGQINDDLGVAPIVLFLTDGDPTAYNNDADAAVIGWTGEALSRAIEEANEVEAQGSHIIAVGVGSALTNAASIDRLKQIAGPNVYDGSGTLDLGNTDVVLVPNFADLPETMALIAAAVCADPELTVEKTANLPSVIPGTEVTYSIDVTNTGNVDLQNVILDDPLVPECSALIGDLAVGETVTVECSITLWGPLTNTATATGSDPFGTPTEGEDSATTTIIASGTGTPGFWKNHTDAWPIADDTILIGDWDHNWACNDDETCLSLTPEEAIAALSTPPRGDMTWNLARPLIAAWLNVSAGNGAACIADTIDAATAWLLTNPIGSGVTGSDLSWEVASVWAETLDDYNNGLLCAESRDAHEETETAETTPSNGGDDDSIPTENPWENGAGGNPPPTPPGHGNKP